MRTRTCSAGLVVCGVLALSGTAQAKMICPMGDMDGSGNGAIASGSGPSGSDRSGSDAPLAPAGAPAPTAPAPGPGSTGRPAASTPAQGSPATAVADVPASAVADVPATTSVPASTGASAPVAVTAPATTTAPTTTTAPAPVTVAAAAPVVDVQAQAAAERAARRAAERRAARKAAARRAAARRASTATLRARIAYQASFDPGTGSTWVEPPASPAVARESGSVWERTVGLGLAALGLALAGIALLRRRGSGGTPAVPVVAPLDPVASTHGDPIEVELQEIIAEERAARELDGLTRSGTR
jgi:hypothetical protein